VRDDHYQHENVSGRQDSVGAAQIKLSQRHGSRLLTVSEQQTSNQESGDHEENPDTEVSVDLEHIPPEEMLRTGEVSEQNTGQ
jgi:hypothetical protein